MERQLQRVCFFLGSRKSLRVYFVRGECNWAYKKHFREQGSEEAEEEKSTGQKIHLGTVSSGSGTKEPERVEKQINRC